MARFFIEHPVFAWVIAILITLAGILSITRLPIEAYPDIAPPQVQVSANYPGADAEVIEHTVTQILEQQLTGIDHLLYFTSSSNSKGNANVTLTFDTGTDPDTALVQTQNRMSLATPRLPAEVNALGLSVQKASNSNVIVLALRSTDGSMNSYELSNLLATRVLDQIQRINGVANVQQFGSEYAMRIWLNPDRLHAYGISPAQVLTTVQGQNVQVAAGSVGSVPVHVARAVREHHSAHRSERHHRTPAGCRTPGARALCLRPGRQGGRQSHRRLRHRGSARGGCPEGGPGHPRSHE
jgi:multidrug efflux pump